MTKLQKKEETELQNFKKSKQQAKDQKRQVQSDLRKEKNKMLKTHKKLVAREYSKKYISPLDDNFFENLEQFKNIASFQFMNLNDKLK